jgi:hypothetical protein
VAGIGSFTLMHSVSLEHNRNFAYLGPAGID